MPEFTGTLRHRVTIEQVVETPNSFNEPVQSWVPFASNVPAEIVPISGSEPYIGEQFLGIVDHQIKTRYLPGVKPKMRVNWFGRLFNILNVTNERELNRRLVMIAKELV